MEQVRSDTQECLARDGLVFFSSPVSWSILDVVEMVGRTELLYI